MFFVFSFCVCLCVCLLLSIKVVLWCSSMGAHDPGTAALWEYRRLWNAELPQTGAQNIAACKLPWWTFHSHRLLLGFIRRRATKLWSAYCVSDRLLDCFEQLYLREKCVEIEGQERKQGAICEFLQCNLTHGDLFWESCVRIVRKDDNVTKLQSAYAQPTAAPISSQKVCFKERFMENARKEEDFSKGICKDPPMYLFK